MYLAANIADRVAGQDAVVLLNTHFNLDAYTTTYPGTKDDDGEAVPGTLQDGQAALRDLQAALAYGKAAMVTVNSAGLWSAAINGESSGTPNYFSAAMKSWSSRSTCRTEGSSSTTAVRPSARAWRCRSAPS